MSSSTSISSSSNTPASSHNSSYKFEHGYPVASTVELAYNNADLGRAVEAYKFFYPTMVVQAQMQSTVSSAGNNTSPNQIGSSWSPGLNIKYSQPNPIRPIPQQC
jgi:hypothetical protein